MSWILTSNVLLCVAFLFLTKNNGPFFTIKTWRQHHDGNTQLTIFKLIFSEKYELLEQKMNSSVQKRPSIVICVKIRHVSHLFHYEFLPWKKGGWKGCIFLWRPTWVTKKPFSLKLLDISTSALEYSSIGPKYTSYVKEKSVHALAFILWTFENEKKTKNVTANKKIFHLTTKSDYLE